MMKFTIIIALLVACIKTEAYRINQCDPGNRFQLNQVTLEPAIPIPGQELHVTIAGSVKTGLNGGKIAVKFPGISVHRPLCDEKAGRYCPIKPGPVNFSFTQNIPRAAQIFGGRSVDGRATVYDESRQVVLCLDILDVQIADLKENKRQRMRAASTNDLTEGDLQPSGMLQNMLSIWHNLV